MTDFPQPVPVGWYCWRCQGLVEQPCRSDNVPVSVPAEWADDMRAEIRRLGDEDDEPPGPAATEATEGETTTRVFAALHRSAEQDVSRVIDLYERWVLAGPPPLGTSMSRWWDRRLAELHDAIRPTRHDDGPSVAEAAADDRAHWADKYAGGQQ